MFSYESAFCSLSLITVWLCDFFAKNIGTKAAHKLLMKLTAGSSKSADKPFENVRIVRILLKKI